MGRPISKRFLGLDETFPDFTIVTRGFGVASVAIVDGGSGYVVGDYVYPGGTFGTGRRLPGSNDTTYLPILNGSREKPIFQVTSVDGGGAITGIDIVQKGSLQAKPANPVAALGYQVASVTITDGGSGYVIGDQLNMTTTAAGDGGLGITVVTVDGAGAVETVTIHDHGDYVGDPTEAAFGAEPFSGPGTGCVVDIVGSNGTGFDYTVTTDRTDAGIVDRVVIDPDNPGENFNPSGERFDVTISDGGYEDLTLYFARNDDGTLRPAGSNGRLTDVGDNTSGYEQEITVSDPSSLAVASVLLDGEDFNIVGLGNFGLGDGVEAAVILRQRSSSRFVCAAVADPTRRGSLTLTSDSTPSANEFYVQVIPSDGAGGVLATEGARKILANKVHTFEGNTYIWSNNLDDTADLKPGGECVLGTDTLVSTVVSTVEE